MKEKAKNRQEEKAGMAQDKNEAHTKMLNSHFSPSFSSDMWPVQEPFNSQLQHYLADARY